MLIIGLTDRRYNYRPHRVLGLVVSLGFIGLLTKKWTDKVYSRPKPVKDTDEGERWLKPGINSKGKLIGAVFVAVFWNGTTGVFVGIVAKGFLKGDPEWFLTFFVIPFVLIGLVLIGSVFYFFIALFNPTIELSLSVVQNLILRAALAFSS